MNAILARTHGQDASRTARQIADDTTAKLRAVSSVVAMCINTIGGDTDSQSLILVDLVARSMSHVNRKLGEACEAWTAAYGPEAPQDIEDLFSEACALAELFNEVCIVGGTDLKFDEQTTCDVLDSIEKAIDQLVNLIEEAARPALAAAAMRPMAEALSA